MVGIRLTVVRVGISAHPSHSTVAFSRATTHSTSSSSGQRRSSACAHGGRRRRRRRRRRGRRRKGGGNARTHGDHQAHAGRLHRKNGRNAYIRNERTSSSACKSG